MKSGSPTAEFDDGLSVKPATRGIGSAEDADLPSSSSADGDPDVSAPRALAVSR